MLSHPSTHRITINVSCSPSTRIPYHWTCVSYQCLALLSFNKTPHVTCYQMRTPGDDHLIVRMNGKYLILITINCSQTKVLWSWFQWQMHFLMSHRNDLEILELKSQDVKKAASLGHLVRLKNLVKF